MFCPSCHLLRKQHSDSSCPEELHQSVSYPRQSSNRYAEERPLIRNTLRKSAPHQRQCHTTMRQPVRTVSGSCASSLRVANKARTPVFNGQVFKLYTPITIALWPGGDQFVSLNIDHANQACPQAMSHQNHRSFNSGVWGHKHIKYSFSLNLCEAFVNQRLNLHSMVHFKNLKQLIPNLQPAQVLMTYTVS